VLQGTIGSLPRIPLLLVTVVTLHQKLKILTKRRFTHLDFHVFCSAADDVDPKDVHTFFEACRQAGVAPMLPTDQYSNIDPAIANHIRIKAGIQSQAYRKPQGSNCRPHWFWLFEFDHNFDTNGFRMTLFPVIDPFLEANGTNIWYHQWRRGSGGNTPFFPITPPQPPLRMPRIGVLSQPPLLFPPNLDLKHLGLLLGGIRGPITGRITLFEAHITLHYQRSPLQSTEFVIKIICHQNLSSKF